MSNMYFPEPFPEEILNEIREYPGNSKCCDCGSLDTDWGSVSHGTLICLDCAGKHRSLGVHVSFVRSIRMDSWSRQQVEMMRQGGNNQIRRFFEKLEIENSPIQSLYCTKGANHYRERLRERVEKIMSGEIKSEKRMSTTPSSPQKPITNIETDLPKSNSGSPDVKTELFKILFGNGTMGMTLTKDSKDRALVSRLVPGGPAQSNGVKIGDYIIGIAGKSVNNYDEIMHMIPCMNRPLEVLFNRVVRIKSPAKILTSKSETFLDKHLIPLDSFSDKSGNRNKMFIDSSVQINRSQSMTNNISPSSLIRRSKSNNNGEEEQQLEYNELEAAINQLTKGVKTLRSPNSESKKKFFSNTNDNDKSSNNNNNKEHGYSDINDNLDNDEVSSEKPSGGITLEPGSVIKVLRNSDKWKTAIIKRVHKDGTFKVAFRDGSVESHVSTDRVALTKSFFDTNGIAIPTDVVVVTEDSNYYNIDNDNNNDDNQYDLVTDDVVDIKSEFVADGKIDLESWIENEEEDENRLSFDNNYIDKFSSLTVNTSNNYVQSLSSIVPPETVISEAVKEYKVIFQEPPLGLTLSVGGSGEPEVIKVLQGGMAMSLGVLVGDVLIRVENRVVYEYDEVMSFLPTVGYPLMLQFRRGKYKSIIENSSELVVQSSKIIATKIMDTMGMNKSNTSLLNAPTAKRLSNNRLQKDPSPSEKTNAISPLSKRLAKLPESNKEFDVIFEEVELGFRLDERIGEEVVSVVTNVTEKSVALEKGISVGCIVLGINYEKYISHAHTVATLKYVKRPVIIRFRK